MAKILFVDDEESIRITVGEFISDGGHEVHTAGDVAEAFDLLKKYDFDVIITDIIMPRISGMELLREIRRTSPDIPIVLMTGEPEVNTASEAVRIGAFDYLAKPISGDVVRKVVRNAAEAKALNDEKKRLGEENRRHREHLEELVEERTKELWESEERLRFVLEGSRLGFWDWNIETDEIQRNERWAEMLGYTLDEIDVSVTQSIDFIHPDNQAAVRRFLQDHLESRTEKHEIEYRMRTRDGQYKWIQDRARIIKRDARGRPLRMSGTHADITERKRMEEALRNASTEWRATFDAISDPICLMDLDGKVLKSNHAYARITGKTFDEIIGWTCWELLHGTKEPIEECPFPRMLKTTRRETSSLSIGERWFEITTDPVLDENGNLSGGVYIMSDITERKRADEALREYQRQLHALSDRLAEVEGTERKRLARELHDRVGQNLTALNINLSIVLRQLPEPLTGEMATRMKDSIALVEETTKCVRDVMTELRPEMLDDYGLMAALRWYGEQFSQRTGLVVEMTGEELPILLPRRVETALFRIAQEAMTNIAKHAQASRVTVVLGEEGGIIRLAVADNGKGYDLTGPSRDQPGWGVMTMQERARALGGNVQIESELGKGTRVVAEIKR